jgi:hypothetical protein
MAAGQKVRVILNSRADKKDIHNLPNREKAAAS